MNILIYGAGAVGCYVGGHLALAGYRVTLLARADTAQALSERGLSLLSAGGSPRNISELTVANSAHEAFQKREYEWIAFTMKAYDTVPAIEELEAAAGKNPPPILCLQNGVGNEESLAAAFGPAQVVAGTLTTPVSVVVPGVVAEEKPRGIVVANQLPAAKRMLAALKDTALRVETTSRSNALKWSKLLLNQMGNATSAILDMPPGEIYAHRGLFRVERQALIETLQVMQANGIPPINLPGVPARSLALLVGWLPARLLQAILAPRVRHGRGGKMPSLHQDMMRGRRRSEVIWLNGAVARAGESVNTPAPVNHALALTLMDILEGRASREQFRNKPQMLLAAVSVARPAP